MFTFHVEATGSTAAAQSLVDKVKQAGMKVGVAVKPDTAIDEVLPLLGSDGAGVDQVLVMTVGITAAMCPRVIFIEPGFGGQSFMPEMMEKVSALRTRFPGLDIQVAQLLVHAITHARLTVALEGQTSRRPPPPAQT